MSSKSGETPKMGSPAPKIGGSRANPLNQPWREAPSLSSREASPFRSRASSLNPDRSKAQQAQWSQQDDAGDEEDEQDDFGTAVVNRKSALETDDEKARLRILLESFNPDQMQRYEVFRRANLNKSNVKRLANQILNQSVNQNVGIVIAGFGKVFVGEIVELAKEVQEQWGDEGPLSPDHLREAYRRYKATKPMPRQTKPRINLLR